MQVDHNPVTILQWCAENGVSFGITKMGDVMSIKAKTDNVNAEYVIDESCHPDAMGKALYMALLATKHGVEYHRKHGYFPPVVCTPKKPLPELVTESATQ